MMEFLKEFPSLKNSPIATVKQIVNQEITNIVGETCEGYEDDTKWWKSKDFDKLEFVLLHSVKKHCLDKKRVEEVIGKKLIYMLLQKRNETNQDYFNRIVDVERRRIKKGLKLE